MINNEWIMHESMIVPIVGNGDKVKQIYMVDEDIKITEEWKYPSDVMWHNVIAYKIKPEKIVKRIVSFLDSDEKFMISGVMDDGKIDITTLQINEVE